MIVRIPARIVLLALALAALAAALALTAAFPADSDAARRTCRSPGSETVVQTGRGRVFHHVTRTPSETVTRTFVCLYRVKRKFLLTRDVRPSDGGGTLSFEYRLTPPFVAFVVAEESPTDGAIVAAQVRVVDARNGRVRRRSADVAGGGVSVTDLELTRTASVAWINDLAGGGHEVQALDAGGQRVLDAGTGIEPTSLTRSGRTMSWVRDGATYSATLP